MATDRRVMSALRIAQNSRAPNKADIRTNICLSPVRNLRANRTGAPIPTWEIGIVVKQSEKRVLVLAAILFGLVATAVSVRWLKNGEIVIRRQTSHNYQTTSLGPVVGKISSHDALFYPVCAAWGLLGVSLIVLSPLAYFRNDEFLMKILAYTCAAILPLGFAMVLLAWLAK